MRRLGLNLCRAFQFIAPPSSALRGAALWSPSETRRFRSAINEVMSYGIGHRCWSWFYGHASCQQNEREQLFVVKVDKVINDLYVTHKAFLQVTLWVTSGRSKIYNRFNEFAEILPELLTERYCVSLSERHKYKILNQTDGKRQGKSRRFFTNQHFHPFRLVSLPFLLHHFYFH